MNEKYIQIDPKKREKPSLSSSIEGDFPQILKQLSEQRTRIDDILIKSRNFQSSKYKLSDDFEKNEENPFQKYSSPDKYIEEIRGYEKGGIQSIDELKKKIGVLKRNGNNNNISNGNNNNSNRYSPVNSSIKIRNSHSINITHDELNRSIDQQLQKISLDNKRMQISRLQDSQDLLRIKEEQSSPQTPERIFPKIPGGYRNRQENITSYQRTGRHLSQDQQQQQQQQQYQNNSYSIDTKKSALSLRSQQIKKIYMRIPFDLKIQKDQLLNGNQTKLRKQENLENRLQLLNKDIFQSKVEQQAQQSQMYDDKADYINIDQFSYFNSDKSNNNNNNFQNDNSIANNKNQPLGVDFVNYQEEFEQLMERQCRETKEILDYVTYNTQNLSKNTLQSALADFKQNFTLHSEKQDKQIRDIKNKYHYFSKFDLPNDYILSQNLQ